MTEKIYEDWIKGVEKTMLDWVALIDSTPKAKELSNGFLIWYSKIIFSPKIMLIGINPNWDSMNGLQPICLDESRKLTYLENYDKDKVGNILIDIYKNAGLFDIFSKSTIKTNYYYLATKNEDDLHSCVNSIPNNFANKFFVQSNNWTQELIEIINPEFIICEGVGVYDKLVSTYKAKVIQTLKKGIYRSVSYAKAESGRIIIGYGRNKYGNIIDPNSISNLLKQIIK